MAIFSTHTSGAIWWQNLELMPVAQSGGQFSTHATNASSAILWPIFQLMQVAKFGTNASGATISWRDNSSLDAIPWVRCASGNVFSSGYHWIK